VYDTRYAPASSAPPCHRRVFYLVLDGEFHSHAEAEATPGPTVWTASEDDIEGSLGRRRHTFRTTGEPYIAVAVHLRSGSPAYEADLTAPPRRLDAPPLVFERARRYADCVFRERSRARWAQEAAPLIAAMVSAGWVTEEAAQTIPPVSRLSARIWDAIFVLFDRAEPSPAMTELAELARMSTRSANRAMQIWAGDYALPAEGFRNFARRWRLKLAVLLLSSLDYSIADVARTVGYGHAEALANALAAEGLPAPRRLREILRGEAGRIS
jgi:AraC-like DNA-binding protein